MRRDLLAPGPARRFRDTILAQGGAKPAADLVRDFLGRPFSVDGVGGLAEPGDSRASRPCALRRALLLLHRHLDDLAGEGVVALLVVVRHVGLAVEADVGTFVA